MADKDYALIVGVGEYEQHEPLRGAATDAQHFEEESFFEYHLYSLGRRTTIADRETKQLALFPSALTPVRKRISTGWRPRWQ